MTVMMTAPISDADLRTLCMFQEANLEPDEGLAAIDAVVGFRTALRYQSDGTIQDTILRHDQFSWTEHAMAGGAYRAVASGLAAELARAQALLVEDERYAAAWARCVRIRQAVEAGTFHGPLFDQLTPDTVLYANLDLCTPPWLAGAAPVVRIGRHSFFRDRTFHAAAPADAVALTRAAIGEAG